MRTFSDTAGVVDAAWATATGPRPDNQDRAAASPRWAIVSDGAGGLPGGATAARLAVEAAVVRLASDPGRLDRAVVEAAVADANRAVRAGQAADPTVATMAATLTLAAAESVGPGGSTWQVANVGDSPAWLVAGDGARRVTRDDNLAAELARTGAISHDEARRHPGRHVITQAIGPAATVALSPVTVPLRPGDALVLASDGIQALPVEAIMEVVDGAPDAQQAARRLVDAALAAGTTDNVTAAVVRHRKGGDRG
jgi:PPM family protein phosphatase